MEDLIVRRAIWRISLCFMVSVILVLAISEGAHLLQKDPGNRAPQIVELIIPAGAAERVAAGMDMPSIPATMAFVQGDTLLVRNEDSVDHQLGPVWVPPGSSASLILSRAEKLAYSCSFQPSRYLGLDVRPPTTIWTRLTALGLAVPPTTAFLLLYSLLVYPLRPQHSASDGMAGVDDASSEKQGHLGEP